MEPWNGFNNRKTDKVLYKIIKSLIYGLVLTLSGIFGYKIHGYDAELEEHSRILVSHEAEIGEMKTRISDIKEWIKEIKESQNDTQKDIKNLIKQVGEKQERPLFRR